MKRLLALFAISLVGCSAADNTHHEASMNFDLENVAPFLEQLNRNLDLDLDVDKLVDFTERLDVDEEKQLKLFVRFNGQSLGIIYQVYMDDFDAPDLYFFAETEELAAAIQSEMLAFAESIGI